MRVIKHVEWLLNATLTCPHCGHDVHEIMPTDPLYRRVRLSGVCTSADAEARRLLRVLLLQAVQPTTVPKSLPTAAVASIAATPQTVTRAAPTSIGAADERGRCAEDDEAHQ
jgi:hypothetical protein